MKHQVRSRTTRQFIKYDPTSVTYVFMNRNNEITKDGKNNWMIILIMPTKLVLHEDRIFYFSIFRMFHDTSVEENLTFHNWFQESSQKNRDVSPTPRTVELVDALVNWWFSRENQQIYQLETNIARQRISKSHRHRPKKQENYEHTGRGVSGVCGSAVLGNFLCGFSLLARNLCSFLAFLLILFRFSIFQISLFIFFFNDHPILLMGHSMQWMPCHANRSCSFRL